MTEIYLTEEQVEDIVYEDDLHGFEVVDKYSSADNSRWNRTNFIILKKGTKFYRLFWAEGLTEYQDDIFTEQTLERVEKTAVVVTIWQNKKEN